MADSTRGSRTLIAEPLTLTGASADAAVDIARDAVAWTCDVLLEDELRLAGADRATEIAFGPWLTRDGGAASSSTVRRRLIDVVAAIVRDRLTSPWHNTGQYAIGDALAAISGVHRTKLFAGLTPRALLAPVLVTAYLTERGYFSNAAVAPYTHPSDVSDDAHAYGIDKQPGRRALSWLGGLVACGGDTAVPLTCAPVVTGLRDDPRCERATPARLASARSELAPFGLDLPSSVSDHFAWHLEIYQAARAVLERGLESGSAVCEARGIDPGAVLEQGFPRWLASGDLAHGPLGSLCEAVTHTIPGADHRFLEVAAGHGMYVLLSALDGPVLARQREAHSGLLFSCDGAIFSGSQLTATICGERRFDRIPGLHEFPPEALEALNSAADETYGVRFDVARDSYLTLPTGTVVLDGKGDSTAVGLVIRSSLASGVHAWSTNVDLRRSGTPALVRARLSDQLSFNAGHNRCVPRFMDEFAAHSPKTPHFSSRTYLRAMAMAANAVLVGVGRAEQATRLA